MRHCHALYIKGSEIVARYRLEPEVEGDVTFPDDGMGGVDVGGFKRGIFQIENWRLFVFGLWGVSHFHSALFRPTFLRIVRCQQAVEFGSGSSLRNDHVDIVSLVRFRVKSHLTLLAAGFVAIAYHPTPE